MMVGELGKKQAESDRFVCEAREGIRVLSMLWHTEAEGFWAWWK